MRVWLNGRVVPLEQARVSVLDHGFTVGDGVFETLRLLRGQPFAPTRHIERLQRSAAALGLPVPDPDLVAAAMADAVAANRELLDDHARLRVTYTSGPGPLGSERGDGPMTLVALAAPGRPWPPTTTVVTVPWPRNDRGPLTGVKSTSYAENAVALARAAAAGASEALLLNTRGELCEGTGSNVFVIRAGGLLTPPLDSGCLAGITRGLVVEWFAVAETAVPAADFASAEEVFLTSSTRNVHPVSRVDEREVAGTQRSAEIARAFLERALDEPDP
jgi:branched-chain amino acid aminotransferase